MSITNLYDKKAQEKIKDIAEDIDFTMLATNLGHKPFHAVPMSTKKVDEEGNIWFLSGKDSTHNQHISNDKYTELIYSDPSDMTFMNLFCEASIIEDKNILKELYGKTDDNWFDGVDDPNLSALKLTPLEAYYWEPKDNKLVTLFKMGVGAITGDRQDLGEHGNLDL